MQRALLIVSPYAIHHCLSVTYEHVVTNFQMYGLPYSSTVLYIFN